MFLPMMSNLLPVMSRTDCEHLMLHFPLVIHDLYIDCEGGFDEHSTLKETGQEDVSCQKKGMYSCSPNNFICYNESDKCVYRENNIGLLSPCRNGGHMSNCTFHPCAEKFKCTESYCIQFNLVCDGVAHCPMGEDENKCTYDNSRTCPGLYKCKNMLICIFVKQLCDGVVDCHSRADDEVLCNILACPDECSCHGLAYDCSHAGLIHIPDNISQDSKYIIITNNSLDALSLKPFKNLLVLNASRNMLLELKSNSFTECFNLLKLDLSRNNLRSLFQNTFAGLANLLELDISYNPVIYIHRDIFAGLSLTTLLLSIKIPISSRCIFDHLRSDLQRLELSMSVIDELSELTFCNLPNVQRLVISDSEVRFIAGYPFRDLHSLADLRTDNDLLCCSSQIHVTCLRHIASHVSCDQLIHSTVLEYTMWTSVFFIFLFNTVSIIFWIYKKSNKKFTTFIISLNISDLMCGMYALLLLLTKLNYTRVYGTWSAENWLPHWLCTLVTHLAHISYQMGLFLASWNAIDRLFLTKYAMKRVNIRLRTWLFIYFVGLVIILTLSMANVYFNTSSHSTCSFLSIYHDYYYIQLLILLSYVLLTVCFCATNSLMVAFFIKREQVKQAQQIK